jgi:hypothetical protein
VVSTLAMAYMACWAVGTITAHLIGKQLADEPEPAVGSLGLSVLAGMVWPFLLVAVVEGGLVAAYCAATNHAARSRTNGLAEPFGRVSRSQGSP